MAKPLGMLHSNLTILAVVMRNLLKELKIILHQPKKFVETFG
jgi:hypothetical protein